MSRNLWYPENRSFDIREEIDNLLFGGWQNAAIGAPVIIRRILDQHCVCWDSKPDPGSPIADCKYCDGEGYLWTEDLETAYIARNYGSVLNPSEVISRENTITPIGITDDSRAVAYMRYTAFPNWERYTIPSNPIYDKLYELKVDDNGQLVHTSDTKDGYIRAGKWQIRSVAPHRGDYSRIEFFEIGLQREIL